MLAQFKLMADLPSVEPEKMAVIDHVIDLCRASQKFLLPENGFLLPDAELRALDESIPLRLPHPFLALEFTSQLKESDGSCIPAKRVVFCREEEDGIYVKPAAYLNSNGFWMVKSDAFIPNTGYLDRSNPNEVKCFAEYSPGSTPKEGFKSVLVVLGFLNAMACSNVYVHSIVPKKSGKKVKSALPFDTYHVLTIDIPGQTRGQVGIGGSHRSPREHLRRGHIRQLNGGRSIWVNATVVAAGKCCGIVKKDYAIRAPA